MSSKLPVVGLVMKSLKAEFFQDMKKGAIEFANKKGGLELVCVGTNNQTEIEKQIQLIEELIEKKVDALVVIPIDSKALVPPVVKAIKAGIKVINIDIRLDEAMLKEHNIDMVFVGPDNETAAKMVGDVLAKQLGKNSKIIIIEGVPAAMNAQQRKQGFLNSIKEYNLILLASGVANWETDQAASVFTDLIKQYPDLQGVMCANDAMALGVLKVLETECKTSDIKVVGFDNDDSVRPLIENGNLLATIDCFGSLMAAEGIGYALKALRGEMHTGWIKTKMKLITK